MLSIQLLGILRAYWRLARPGPWLFPGRDDSKPMDVQVLHAACRSACAAAGLGKRVTVPVQVDDGQWTFLAAVGSLPSTVSFTLDVTDASNNTASVNSNFRVLLDITNHLYTAMQVSKTGDGMQSIELFNTDGRDLYNMSYNGTGKNSHDLTFSPHVHPNTFTFVSADTSHETITDFIFSGTFHDMMSMPSNDFTSMADVIRNSSLSHSGDWNITDPKTHSVLTITGVTPSEIRAASHDFSFNGTGHIL